MARIPMIVVCVLASIGMLQSQPLPPSARHELDKRFPHWQIRPNYIPSPCDQPGSPRSNFKPVSKCNLNGDGIPDYMVTITTGKESNLVEYFVALVSKGKRYEINLFDSVRVHQGAGERVCTVIPASDTTAAFGSDTLVYNYGKSVGHSGITFPTDVVEIYAECDGRWKEADAWGFVFIRGRFRMFSAAD